MVPGLLGAALAVTAWGSASVLAKAIDLGGLVIAVYRFLSFFVLMLAWMRLRRAPFRLAVLRYSALGGIALALDVALFFSAVKETSVMNATLIGALQPVVVGVIAARFFGERVRPRDAVWALVALVGVVAVIVSGSDSQVSSLRGDLLSVGALFCWSGYFIASKHSKARLTSTEFTAGTAFWAGALNLPMAFVVGQELVVPTATDVVYLVVMTGVAGVLGHSLMNWALVQIPLWVGSTFTLLIPVAASAMAWLLLGEPLIGIQIVGALVVLCSLAAIVVGQARAQRGAADAVSQPAPS